jgi:hypothetical protein
MDWSNRFTLGGFTVTYSTFQMAWEVIDERGDNEGYAIVGFQLGREQRDFV